MKNIKIAFPHLFKVIFSSLSKEKSSHPNPVHEDEKTYSLPHKTVKYTDLSSFEKSLFDYYKFDRNKVVQCRGFVTTSVPSVFFQNPLDGTFTTDNQSQSFKWEEYDPLDHSITYRIQIAKCGISMAKLNYTQQNDSTQRVFLLFDRRDSANPILLATAVIEVTNRANILTSDQIKIMQNLKYVGPRS